MSDAIQSLINNLKNISRIDSQLAGILAERKKAENELLQKVEGIRKLQRDRAAKSKVHDEKQQRCRKDEKHIKEEREKLVERRKALSTLNNYKLQQSAEREIEHAAKQLDTHEDSLLGSLDELEKFSKELQTLDAQMSTLSDELKSFESEARGLLSNLEERQKRCLDEKAELVQHVDARSLQIYERVRERYPHDAVVAIKRDFSCAGCFMQLGPQIVVEIGRSSSVVKCRGCGRILFVEESKEQ